MKKVSTKKLTLQPSLRRFSTFASDIGKKVSTKKLTWQPSLRRFSTFASDIGLKSGEWPSSIILFNELGEVPFYKKLYHIDDGELIAMIYENASTVQLKIFND